MKDKIVVLDTNVLLHDPEAPHRFGDLRVVIPMQVVEELSLIHISEPTRPY